MRQSLGFEAVRSMLMQPSASKDRRLLSGGFTLIELMVTLTVLSIVLVLAAPSFVQWVNNARIRSVAQGIQDGVRAAQAEAVRRNRVTEFFFTNATPALNSASQVNGNNWGIRSYANPPAAAEELVKVGMARAVDDQVTVQAPRSICFGPAGNQITLVVANCVPAEHQINLSTARGDRPLRIVVSVGGRVRMCDPAKVLSADAPEGC